MGDDQETRKHAQKMRELQELLCFDAEEMRNLETMMHAIAQPVDPEEVRALRELMRKLVAEKAALKTREGKADHAGGTQGRPAWVYHDELTAPIEARLAQLPLKREGFEDRTSYLDWVFWGVWPIGDDLAPVIEQRAADIEFLIFRSRHHKPAAKPRKAADDVARKFQAFAEVWQNLPEGSRPILSWRTFTFSMRSAISLARLQARSPTRVAIADMIATAYVELTGKLPSHHSNQPTPFGRLVRDIFGIAGIQGWLSATERAAALAAERHAEWVAAGVISSPRARQRKSSAGEGRRRARRARRAP
jgi:hypothetical protein